MKVIKYHASASFDIETEIQVEDNDGDLEIWLAIMCDLENRYGLSVSFKQKETEASS